MQWIYLSPHFDDVVLSCGGLVWEQVNRGDQVAIWTICAGEPIDDKLSPFASSLHKRWNIDREVVCQRKEEDLIACQRLGAIPQYSQISDCIYRQDKNGLFLYPSEEAIFGDMHQEDLQRVYYLLDQIGGITSPNSQLVCPLAIGNHIDHRLVRMAVEMSARRTWYYADYPYVLEDSVFQTERKNQEIIPEEYPISEDGLTTWINAIEAYTSQISSFWLDQASMDKAIRDYVGAEAKVCLWKQIIKL